MKSFPVSRTTGPILKSKRRSRWALKLCDFHWMKRCDLSREIAVNLSGNLEFPSAWRSESVNGFEKVQGGRRERDG